MEVLFNFVPNFKTQKTGIVDEKHLLICLSGILDLVCARNPINLIQYIRIDQDIIARH